jgi:hypothetical protein
VTEVFRSLRWLEPIADLARFGVFAGFVALGLAVVWRRHAGGPVRPAVHRLVIYVVVVSCGVGLVQQESWPFTTWALVHHKSPARMQLWELEALDQAGGRWRVDPDILAPMPPEEFGAWLSARFRGLPESERVAIARFLLERAEADRRRLREGGAFPHHARLLGPLTAPFHFRTLRIWRAPEDVPATAFTALRIWRQEWNVEERFADHNRFTRTLILEYRHAASD